MGEEKKQKDAVLSAPFYALIILYLLLIFLWPYHDHFICARYCVLYVFTPLPRLRLFI